MNASICRAALIAVTLLLSLSPAKFASSAELTYIDANDRISDGSTTTYFDLALHTDKVTINGVPAESVARGFSDVYVKPVQPIPIGSSFQVTIGYSGKPGDIRQGDVRPWWAHGSRVT